MASTFRVFPTASGLVIESDGARKLAAAAFGFDAIFSADSPAAVVEAAFAEGENVSEEASPAPLIEHQEVWAAGVTYLRSRTARMEESKDAGGGDFYDRVYDADRPELFFKAAAHRVAAPGAGLRIRSDSKWNVPEPEFTLAINAAGKVFGYTVGNDMSSRDIEGENPLYLPQAKSYHLSAGLGPCLVVAPELPDASTTITIEIVRAGETVFSGETALSQIKRSLTSLADWLYKDNAFPAGAYLMTGTGVVPGDEFTLHLGDEMRITIPPVGTLVNTVIA